MLELRAITRVSRRQLGTLRRIGKLPAVLYGPTTTPMSLAVELRDFQRVFAEAGESSLIRLIVDADGSLRPSVVLIREVQRDPLRGTFQHVDFHAVRLDEEITVAIPLQFVGSSPVESRGEGVIVKELHELEVEALPEKLPHAIEVDVSGLQAIDDVVTVRDLSLPDGVRAVADPATVIVRAAPLMSEAEIAAIETPSEESVAHVEVVGKEEEGEEGEEGNGELPES